MANNRLESSRVGHIVVPIPALWAHTDILQPTTPSTPNLTRKQSTRRYFDSGRTSRTGRGRSASLRSNERHQRNYRLRESTDLSRGPPIVRRIDVIEGLYRETLVRNRKEDESKDGQDTMVSEFRDSGVHMDDEDLLEGKGGCGFIDFDKDGFAADQHVSAQSDMSIACILTNIDMALSKRGAAVALQSAHDPNNEADGLHEILDSRAAEQSADDGEQLSQVSSTGITHPVRRDSLPESPGEFVSSTVLAMPTVRRVC